jgi:hypothetical protein
MNLNMLLDLFRATAHGFSRRMFMTIVAFSMLLFPARSFGAGGWAALTGKPTDSIGLCMLLPDGTVLAEGSGSNWWSLKPDNNGHYVNGVWSARQSSSWGHQDGSTAVLANGNVFISGGENGNGTNKVEIFYHATDSWSVAISSTFFGNIYDGNAMLLPDGKVLIEPQNAYPAYSGLTFTFNPNDNTFSQTAGAPLNGIAEAAWVKLPNDNILLIDSDNSSMGATTAEMYNPDTGLWQNAVFGGTVPNIWPDVSGTSDVSESGPAFLLPNGSAVFFGGNGVTAIYNNGFWSQGETIPDGLGMKDAPGAMMVNGKILLAVCPTGTNSDPNAINGIGPTTFYEYDYTMNNGAGGYTATSAPDGGVSSRAQRLQMLDLPDGTVLLSGLGSQLYVYQPDGEPLSTGKPTIYSYLWDSDGTIHITGTLFNGISQGACFGDERQMDSNYPLARFTDCGGNVHYGRTYNWSSTSVMTGSRPVTTECAIPSSILYNAPGALFSMSVVANGIGSDPVAFYGPVWVDFNYTLPFQNGMYGTPYGTLANGVANVPSGGTIILKPGVSAETTLISKPMTITAVAGPATIGF